MHQRVDILGVRVSAVNPELACAQLKEWVAQRHKTYVCVAPVSTLVDANRDPAYRDIVNAAGMVTPDGMPVAWLARSKGFPQVRRTYGPDLMCAMCAVPGIKHFLLGSTPAVLVTLEKRLREQYPGIIIVGARSLPQREAQVEDGSTLAAVNDAHADIIWLALGSPKQDRWMALNRPLLQAPVIVGVGAAFDFLAGVKAQAPVWMQQCGLEWLFRLMCEPKRLWRRYLVGNTLFVFYLMRSIWQKQH